MKQNNKKLFYSEDDFDAYYNDENGISNIMEEDEL